MNIIICVITIDMLYYYYRYTSKTTQLHRNTSWKEWAGGKVKPAQPRHLNVRSVRYATQHG